MELGLQIPIASGIPDSMNCFPDSKTQYFGFHEQNLHGGINYAKLLRLGKWWLALLNLCMHALMFIMRGFCLLGKLCLRS